MSSDMAGGGYQSRNKNKIICVAVTSAG